MAHLHLPDETNAPVSVRGVLHETRERWGFLPNLVRALAIRPDLMQAEDQWSKACMYGGVLPRALKEAVATTVSVVNGSNYCATSHSYQARRAGADATLSESCRTLEFAARTDPERKALEFARKAATDMNSVEAQDIHDLRSDFSDGEIIELVAVISSFMMYNSFVALLGLELETHVHGEGLLTSTP